MADPTIVSFDLALTQPLQFILGLGSAVAAALVGGAIAARLRQPVIVGYLAAGVAIGPFTPGFTGDVEQISALADVGVILLLFALGVEFSLRDLRSVRDVALPGGVVQIALVLLAGGTIVLGLGYGVREAFVVGACLSISSTLVVIKSLLDRGEIDSLHGRTAIGWSIVQDVATIIFIVALPPLAGGDLVVPFALAMVKAALFLVLAYVVGTRVLPIVFRAVSRMGSAELFLLTVVATALLTAFVSSAIFGLSLALGAFVAGIIVAESDLSYQAAAEVIPFRELIAVLFVVAVVGKGALVALFGKAFGLPVRSALLLGGTMAQVGEFSFILAEDGLHLNLIDGDVYNMILGTAVVSILLTPFAQRIAEMLALRFEAQSLVAASSAVDRSRTSQTEVAAGG